MEKFEILFLIGLLVLMASLILRYLFPEYDDPKSQDKLEKIFTNDQDPNGN